MEVLPKQKNPKDQTPKTLELDDVECPICYEIMAEPVQTPCKHYLCLSCHNESMKIKTKCPMCREIFSNDFNPIINKTMQTYISKKYQEDFLARKQDLISKNLWTEDLIQ